MNEVKALKPGWRQVKFGDVVRLSKNRSQDPLADGIERYVGLEHLEPGDLRIRRWGNVADGVTFTSVFKPGQVLFGKRRAYQRKVAVADFSGVCSGDIYVLETKDAQVLLPELLPFICQTDAFFDHAVGTSAGSLSPRTNWTSLADFEFALPPVTEQLAIVNACGAALETVVGYEEALRASLAYQASLREQIFSITAIPTCLGDVLDDIQAGKSLVGVDEPPSSNEVKAVLKVSAVGKRSFLPAESKTLIQQEDFMDIHVVRTGDILITRANTPDLVGLACLVTEDHKNLMLSDKTLRLVPSEGMPNRLLLEALRTQSARQFMKANATGTGGAMKNISQAKLREMAIKLPDESEWSEHATELENAETMVSSIEARHANAKKVARLAMHTFLRDY